MIVRVTPSASFARKDDEARGDESRWPVGWRADLRDNGLDPALGRKSVELARERRLRRLAREHEADVLEARAP